MKKLTKMQQKVYDYIAQFMTEWGYPLRFWAFFYGMGY